MTPPPSCFRNAFRRLAGCAAGNDGLQAQLDSLRKELRTLREEEIPALKERISEIGSARLWSEISRRIKKEPKVVFLSRGFFGDNIKYAFLAFAKLVKEKGPCPYLYLTASEDEYKLLSEQGLPVKLWNRNDRELSEFLLRARVAVQTDHFIGWSHDEFTPADVLSGAKTIQLWHGGLGQKQIALKNIGALSGIQSRILRNVLQTDVMLSRSSARSAYLTEAFQAGETIVEGYPRLDVLRREPTDAEMLNVDSAALDRLETAKSHGKKTILYAPTFRDTDNRWLKPQTLKAFGDMAANNNAVVAVNLHPYDQGRIPELKASLPFRSDMFFIRGQSDIYPLLRHMDALITDYSSIYGDFLLLDKPVIFFRPDQDSFVKESRALAENRMFDPGPVATTLDELAARTFETDPAELQKWADFRRESNEALNEKADGGASRRMAERIFRMATEGDKA
ncbi:MAG: CDP-glycerol glycerophosphotransferase family protein [Alphaproteobacteria bacterium]|nr:CDP-glycerol glycerophosphotransferase family protein [Alphaproteobacteria bacterium]